MSDLIRNYFNTYESEFLKFEQLVEADMPRSLRLFNFRFRLALDIEIGFVGELSNTKTPIVKKTYIALVKLMEVWNAYEALLKYVQALKPLQKEIMSRKVGTENLKVIGSLELLEETLDWIKASCKKNKRFKEGFIQYIQRMIDEPSIKKQLTEDLNDVLACLNDNKNISGVEVLSLIYAERNMYYHNGETARMGMNYVDRKDLLDKYREILILHTLKLITNVLTEEISKAEG